MGQGPHVFRMVRRIVRALCAEQSVYHLIVYLYHACMSVDDRLYGTPRHEEAMGWGPHVFRMDRRIVRALRA